MEIKEIGKRELTKRLAKIFEQRDEAIYGQRCAAKKSGEGYLLSSTYTMAEGVHFDLTYTPLKHLGYKAVVGALTNIAAMNGKGETLTISVALSSRFSVEATEDLYLGFDAACRDYGVSYMGGELTASLTGLTITITAQGYVSEQKITLSSGAKANDIICVTGDLGAAYLGLKLLEREKRVLKGNNVSKPKLEGYEYLLQRQLKPVLQDDFIESLESASLQPSAMTAITESLASDLKSICQSSGVGAMIYLDRLPIAQQTFDLCDTMNIDPVIAAINGGDDFAMLFTISPSEYERVAKIEGVDIIGHTIEGSQMILSTPDGGAIDITSPNDI